jgi:hypothetical protein
VESLGHFSSVTERTLEGHPEFGCPPRLFGYPRSELERWTVTDVLVVAARELCHPLGNFVLVVSGDSSFHNDQGTCALSESASAFTPQPFLAVVLTRRKVSTRSAWRSSSGLSSSISYHNIIYPFGRPTKHVERGLCQADFSPLFGLHNRPGG